MGVHHKDEKYVHETVSDMEEKKRAFSLHREHNTRRNEEKKQSLGGADR